MCLKKKGLIVVESAVGIATCYGLDGPGIESRWGRDFSHLSRPALGPTQSCTTGSGSFPGVNRPRCGVDHPPHLAPRLKEEYSYTSAPSLGLRGLFQGEYIFHACAFVGFITLSFNFRLIHLYGTCYAFWLYPYSDIYLSENPKSLYSIFSIGYYQFFFIFVYVAPVLALFCEAFICARRVSLKLRRTCFCMRRNTQENASRN